MIQANYQMGCNFSLKIFAILVENVWVKLNIKPRNLKKFTYMRNKFRKYFSFDINIYGNIKKKIFLELLF